MTTLGEMRAAVIDMDGVLWRGDQPLPGLGEFFDNLRALDLPFRLATNNAGRTPEAYQARLAGMGVRVRPSEVLTSAVATAGYLAQVAQPGARIFAIGAPALREALAAQGFELVALHECTAQYVVVGMDPALSWDKLATATLNIRAGAQFVGTNPDLTFPTERGLTHGNGAILAALQAATGVAPLVIGKPEPIMYRQALLALGTPAALTVAIGDRLDTDILGAERAGLPSVLVLSGVSTRAEAEAPGAARPTWIMQDIAEITRRLRAERAAAAGTALDAKRGG